MIELNDTELESLINHALAVRLKAHAPYSRFAVGAALLTATRELYVGCNIENASFSLTLCAERAAAAAAISGGHSQWIAIAVASHGGVTPCGACRQFLAEFGNDLLILCVDAKTRQVNRFQLSALLPHAFGRLALPTVS
ncbi:MAG: cytidine deaminase [Planctomycetaceae bacterium]